MKILFLHGWQSTPGGLKPTYLKDHGHEVLNPALPEDDFDASVRIAQAEYDRGQPDVVVGSSRGGAVAMNINCGDTPLVLLCPAWKTWGAATKVKTNTTILHSEADETVPIADSQELLENSGRPESALIVVGTEHRLADEESLEAMVEAVEHTMAQQDDIQKSLAPPGAGLPVVQAFPLRYLLFPAYCRMTSWRKALAVFQLEGERVIALVEPLSPEQVQERVLVKAPLGVEDSSRYWSAEMVLEHLIEVGTRVATGIVELTQGDEVTVKADVADVKPKGWKGVQVIEDFKAFVLDYARTLTEDVGDRKSTQTHPHPWFGELRAHQWACLGGLHQTIHRRQMERIVAGLRGKRK